MTGNNHQSFHLCSIFSAMLHLHIRVAFQMYLLGQPTSHQPHLITRIKIFIQGKFFIKQQKVQRVLVTMAHLHGLGMLRDEDWVVNMGSSNKELMNSLLCAYDVH